MTTIKDLIQETEKGCGKEYIYENSIDIFMICGQEKGDYCPICQAKLSTLKKCQTIEDENIKDLDIKLQAEIYNNSVLIDNYKEKIINIIEGLRCYGIRLDRYNEVWCIDKNELKQQLNPAQTKN
jgi:hypothetical protein